MLLSGLHYSETPAYKRSNDLSVCSDVKSAEEAPASFALVFQFLLSATKLVACAVNTKYKLKIQFVSQLNMYQNAVNRLLRHPDDKPTIGLLLVKGKNRTVVEYSLAGYTNPIGVADWRSRSSKIFRMKYGTACLP